MTPALFAVWQQLPADSMLTAPFFLPTPLRFKINIYSCAARYEKVQKILANSNVQFKCYFKIAKMFCLVS